MACNEIVGDVTSESIESLRLPPAFNETIHLTALELDALLSQDECPVTSLDTKMAA